MESTPTTSLLSSDNDGSKVVWFDVRRFMSRRSKPVPLQNAEKLADAVLDFRKAANLLSQWHLAEKETLDKVLSNLIDSVRDAIKTPDHAANRRDAVLRYAGIFEGTIGFGAIQQNKGMERPVVGFRTAVKQITDLLAQPEILREVNSDHFYKRIGYSNNPR